MNTTKTGESRGSKRWSRRMLAMGIWMVVNYGSVYLQPLLSLDKGLVQLLVEKSTWIVGGIIIGISGTDAVRDWRGNGTAEGAGKPTS